MDGKDFIALAQRLSSPGNNAAEYRTAVSRAYYGCFHAAQSFLNQFGWYCHETNVHKWVPRHFLNCTTASFMSMGKTLENMHTSRKLADYDLDKPTAESERAAAMSIERAGLFMYELAAVGSGEARKAIQQEMNDYRKKVNLV